MNKVQLISDFAAGTEDLQKIVNVIPKEWYDRMPKTADDWTIRQHIIHLVDSEVNNFIRIKSCVAQPHSNVYVINELEWTKNLGARQESVSDYVLLFSLIRKITVAFLSELPDGDFAERYFTRDYNGEVKNISLRESVEMYTGHVGFHIDFINRILGEFRENP